MATIAERINKAKQDDRKVSGKGTASLSIEERIRMAKQDSAPVAGGTPSIPSGAVGSTSPVKGEAAAPILQASRQASVENRGIPTGATAEEVSQMIYIGGLTPSSDGNYVWSGRWNDGNWREMLKAYNGGFSFGVEETPDTSSVVPATPYKGSGVQAAQVLTASEQQRQSIENGAKAQKADASETMRNYIGANAKGWDEALNPYLDLVSADQGLRQVERLNEVADRNDKYTERGGWWDNFFGQFAANYGVGDLELEADKAFGAYVRNPTADNLDYANALDWLSNNYQNTNKDALDEKGEQVPLISKSVARQLPQTWDQTKSRVAGEAVSAVIGGGLGGPGGYALLRKAIVPVASASTMNDQFAGAAYRALIAAGVDEETAIEAAKDEAFVQSLTEAGDTLTDIITFGLSGKLSDKLVGGAGKLATANAIKKIGATKGGRLFLRAMPYAVMDIVNSAGEGLQESAQESVTIANTRRDGSGVLDLIGEAVKLQGNVLAGNDSEAAQQMREAGVEAFKTSLVLGPLQGGLQSGTGRAMDTAIQRGLRSGVDQQSAGETNGSMAGQETENAASGVETASKYDAAQAAEIQHEGKTFRNLVVGFDTKVSEFFDRWRSGRKSHQGEKLEKLYMGKMPLGVKAKVADLLGYEVDERDFIVTNDDVKHVFDHHGDPEHEIEAGNIPLEPWMFDALPDVLANPDSITPGHVGESRKNSGKRGVLFSKAFPGGTVITVQYDNPGRKTMGTATIYAKNKGATSELYAPVETDTSAVRPGRSEPAPIVNTTIPHPANSVNSGVAQGFGESGTKVVAEIAQNRGTTIQQEQNRVGLAYQTGRSNLPGTQLDLTDIDQQRAYNAGQMDYLTENPGTKDLVTGQKEGYTDIKTEVPSDGAEEVHLRGSGQRADGTNPGGAVSAVESRTGGNQVRQEQGRPADPEAASLTYGEAVSTASLGIGKGSEDATVRVVTGGDTADTRAAKQLAKERGLRLTLFVGGNLSINGESVRAYITGDRAFVRADHPDFTSAQLMRHEAGHDMIAKGEIDPKTVRERIAERFDGEQLDRVTQMYIEAYAGSGLTVKEIWNEIICDSLGDMNIFSETASEDAAWELLTATKAASADAKAETSRGPPVGEGKMSRDLDERRRALRKGEMVNEFRDKVNWRNYYQKIISDEYNPDYFDDGDIARMPLDGVILKMKMLRNGEWSVVGIEEDVVYGGSKKDSGRADSPDAGTELSEERGTDGDLLNQNSGESGADGARNQTFDRSGADTQRGREGNPTDYSGAGLTEGEASIELERPKVERAAETYTKLFKQCQEMTPAQIVRLTEQDADTTPELTRPEPSGINADTGKESKLYSSAEKSENVANETWGLIQSVDDIKYYQGISNMDTLNRASERLATNGQAETLRFATLDPKEATAVDVAEGFILLKRYQDKGDYESAVTVLHKLREIGTTSGQAVQSFSLLGRLTPEGMAVYAQRELDQARKEMVRKKSEEWVDKRRAQFELTPEEVQFIMDTMERAAELPEGRDKNILIARIATMIEDKIPTTILKQIKGFTRNAMLLNTKTMMRNVVGNAIMMPAYVVQDFIAAGVDASIAKRTGVRTTGTTLPNKAALRAAKRGVYESFDDFRREVNTRQTSGDRFEVGGGPAFKRYSDGEMQEAGRARRLAMELSNALNKVDRVTGWLLDMGDRPFFEYHFTNSLNNQLRLNQTTQPTAEMIDIATTEALRRTWQDDNAYTKAVTTLRNTLNGGKDWGVGSAITTFVKTPANLTKALLEYSPLGLVGVLKNRAGIYTRSKKSKNFDPRTQKAFVDALSKSITGTLVMALGGLLAHVDLISGGDDEEDKDVAAFKQNVMGIAPYSVKIGGKSYTYDWAQPVGGLFAISADFVTNIKNGNEPAVTGLDILGDAGKAIMNALAAGGNVLFEQSFLQGVADLFADDGLVSGLISALSGASGQFVPTALSQIAQLADPYARTSFAYRDIPRTTVNKVIAKTPGLRSTLPAVVDVLGHDVLSYGGNNSVWNVFFNPANVYSETATKAAKEIYRVYEETGDTTIIPRKAPYYLEYKGERYNFTGEERADYQRAMGGTNEQVVGQLLESRLYKRLTDEKKATVLYEITNYSAAVAKKQFLAGKQIEYEGSSWKPWMEHAQNALAMGVSAADYIILHLKKDELESKKGQYKDKNGNTKDYAESYLIMDMVYKSGAATGLTKTQRKKLFEALGVAKAVSDKEKENVEDELNNLKTSAA